MKKIVLFSLVLILTVAMVGCGKKKSEKSKEPKEEKKQVKVIDNEEKPSQNQKPDQKNPPDTEPVMLPSLPAQFTYSSGMGSWKTKVFLTSDGQFQGEFSDWEATSTPEYPEGKIVKCPFKGAFKDIEKISEYEYHMKLDYVEPSGVAGEEIVDGRLVETLVSVPYGFENGGDFILYLPGRATDDLNEEFLYWISVPNAWQDIPPTLTIYGLFSVQDQIGFYEEEQ